MAEKRWQRRKEDRSGEILEAALGCFAKKGFAATRMEDIAAGARIAKGTLYLYFDSKEAVFKALARGSMGARLQAIQGIVTAYQGSAAELLRLVISSIGEFAATSDRVILPKLLLAEAGNFPELLKFWRAELIDQGLGMLQSVIKRGIDSGEFRTLPAEHVARLCIAPMLVVMLWRTTFGVSDKVPYDHRGLVETHIDVLLHGLTTGSSA